MSYEKSSQVNYNRNPARIFRNQRHISRSDQFGIKNRLAKSRHVKSNTNISYLCIYSVYGLKECQEFLTNAHTGASCHVQYQIYRIGKKSGN